MNLSGGIARIHGCTSRERLICSQMKRRWDLILKPDKDVAKEDERTVATPPSCPTLQLLLYQCYCSSIWPFQGLLSRHQHDL